MRIIVEGPDGSGKTVLARWIDEKLHLPYIHGGGPPGTPREARIRLRHPLIHPRGVFDRTLAISESVYGPLRGSLILPEEELDRGIRSLIRENCLFIHCTPPDELLHNRLNDNLSVVKEWKSSEHCQSVRVNFESILESYQRIFAKIRRMGGMVFNYQWGEGYVRSECGLWQKTERIGGADEPEDCSQGDPE